MISGPLEKASGHERYEGLREALADLGVMLQDSLVRNRGSGLSESIPDGCRSASIILMSPWHSLGVRNSRTKKMSRFVAGSFSTFGMRESRLVAQAPISAR